MKGGANRYASRQMFVVPLQILVVRYCNSGRAFARARMEALYANAWRQRSSRQTSIICIVLVCS